MDAPTAPGSTRIGFIGTGVMGASMCSHIMDGGYSVSVYNRTASKAEPLVAKGATLCESPLEVAKNSDIVFTIVGMPEDVESVILGEEGVLAGLRSGGVVCDMTTSKPSLAQQIATTASEKGVGSVDAPVSGGDVGAKAGTLSIMVGGDAEPVAAVMPLFELMGKNIRHMGGAGKGQSTKSVNQILIASGMVGVCEGLLFCVKSGMKMEEAIAAVEAGAAGSWSISNLGPRIAGGDFRPGFYVEHFIKDLGIALEECRRMRISLPGLALAHQLYVAVQAQGHGRKGTHALYLALEKLNGIERDADAGSHK